MIRLSQLIGQATISVADAERTGRVKGVVVEGDRIVGIHNGDGIVDAAAIRSFEGDALTYDGSPRTVPEPADSPLGRRVLDDDGDELGSVADLELDAEGTIGVILLDDGRTVPGVALRAIGSYAVIVAARPDTTVKRDAGTAPLPPPPEGSVPQ
jgi:sporulation protein YlmC with PRC-barrel domain